MKRRKKNETDLHLHTGKRKAPPFRWIVAWLCSACRASWPHVELWILHTDTRGNISRGTRTFRVKYSAECSSASEIHFIHSSHERMSRAGPSMLPCKTIFRARYQDGWGHDYNDCSCHFGTVAVQDRRDYCSQPPLIHCRLHHKFYLNSTTPFVWRLQHITNIRLRAGFLNTFGQFCSDPYTNYGCAHTLLSHHWQLQNTLAAVTLVLVMVLLTNVFGVRFSGAGNVAQKALPVPTSTLTLRQPEPVSVVIFIRLARFTCVLRRMARR